MRHTKSVCGSGGIEQVQGQRSLALQHGHQPARRRNACGIGQGMSRFINRDRVGQRPRHMTVFRDDGPPCDQLSSGAFGKRPRHGKSGLAEGRQHQSLTVSPPIRVQNVRNVFLDQPAGIDGRKRRPENGDSRFAVGKIVQFLYGSCAVRIGRLPFNHMVD